MLIFSSLIVILAPCLHIRDDQRLEFFLTPGLPFPHSCLAQSWFGFKCPGCGLTRSLVSLSSGNIQKSFQYHQLGWLFAIAILFQVPFRCWALYKQQAYPLGIVFPKFFGWLLVALLVLFWSYQQIKISQL